MDSNQIIYFLTLCDELHFTRAAEHCGIAQPSLSNAMRALESEIGGPLFDGRPKIRLSELGKSVRPHLRRALAEIECAMSCAKEAPAAVRASNRPSSTPTVDRSPKLLQQSTQPACAHDARRRPIDRTNGLAQGVVQ